MAKGQTSQVVEERVEGVAAQQPLFGYEFRYGWGFLAFVLFVGLNVLGLIIWMIIAINSPTIHPWG